MTSFSENFEVNRPNYIAVTKRDMKLENFESRLLAKGIQLEYLNLSQNVVVNSEPLYLGARKVNNSNDVDVKLTVDIVSFEG